MALLPSEDTFLFASDLVHYIMVDNDIEWEPSFRTYETESKFTANIAIAVIKIGEKIHFDILEQFDVMKERPVETAEEFSEHMLEFVQSFFQESSSFVKYFTFCAYVTSLTVLLEQSGITGSANAAVYLIAEVLEGQLSEYFRNRTIWETLVREAETCIDTETKLSFAVEFMSHVMIVECVEWRTSLEACDSEVEFKKVVRTMDRIRTKRYNDITQEFNNIYGTSVKTKDQFSDYIKEMAKSYFREKFDSLKFLDYCAHVGLLAVLCEKKEIRDSADTAVYAIVEVLETQELKREAFWEAMLKAALNYQEAEINLSFAISLMSHVMKTKCVEWKTSFEVCDIESEFTEVIGKTMDIMGRKNYGKVSQELADQRTAINTKDQFGGYVKGKADSYFQRGYGTLKCLSYCAYVTNLAAHFEMKEMNGSADVAVQILADVLGNVIPEETKGQKNWESLFYSALNYNTVMGTEEHETPRAKRQKTS